VALKRRARILLSLHRDEERSAVVVSAMSGVTDGLLELLDLAASRNDDYLAKLHGLKERHLHTMAHLGLSAAPQQSLAESIACRFQEHRRSSSEESGSPGFHLSAPANLFPAMERCGPRNCCMRIWKTPGHSSSWLDARKVLIVEPDRRTVAVDWDLSREKLQSWQAAADPPPF
jgi:aspartokinase/homoserine dehydrogenase 1